MIVSAFSLVHELKSVSHAFTLTTAKRSNIFMKNSERERYYQATHSIQARYFMFHVPF